MNSQPRQRLLALDVMRGITIASMILVNSPGSWSYRYAPLAHAEWHGLTFTDLVFPFFLFMVGAALAFGLPKMQALPRTEAIIKIVKRGLLLAIVGYLIHDFPLYRSFEDSRVPGVLQRIGFAYIFAATLALYLKPKALFYTAVAILLGYWGLLNIASSDPYSLEGNITTAVDVAVFGDHIYKGFGIPFDPEGILGTIPAIVTVLIGLWSGLIIRGKESLDQRLISLAAWGSILLVVGLTWSLTFPINKPLWTSTYVLVTGGIGMLTLFTLTWLIDVKGYKKWSWPFVVYGSNALLAYCISELFNGAKYAFSVTNEAGQEVTLHALSFDPIFIPIFGEYFGSFIYAILHVVAIWFVLYPLYKKNILVKL